MPLVKPTTFLTARCRRHLRHILGRLMIPYLTNCLQDVSSQEEVLILSLPVVRGLADHTVLLPIRLDEGNSSLLLECAEDSPRKFLDYRKLHSKILESSKSLNDRDSLVLTAY